MKNLYSLYLADKTLMMAIKENETREIKNEMCVDKLAASCSSEMQLIIKKHMVRTQSQAYVYLFLQPWPNTICDSNGKPEQTQVSHDFV